nr:uncharacterized protein LOC109158413 [Ipomoea trifida]
MGDHYHTPVAHQPQAIPTLGARTMHEVRPPWVTKDPPQQNPAPIVNRLPARQESTEECTTLRKELEGLIEKRIALRRNIGRPPQGGRPPVGPNQWRRQVEMPMHEIEPTGHEAEARSEAPRIARET